MAEDSNLVARLRDTICTEQRSNRMRVAGPEASGEATGPEGDDSNMGTAPTSGPEATSSQGNAERPAAFHDWLEFDRAPAAQCRRCKAVTWEHPPPAGPCSAVETAGEQPQTRISVTLTAEEFEAMVAREKKLTDELEEADAINGQGVNREVALERANATLVARVNRLRNRIGKAYDALAAAKAEDVQPVETSEPIEHADQCNFWIDGECNCGAADRNAEKATGEHE